MRVFQCNPARDVAAADAHFGSDLHQLSHDLRTPLNHINGFAELLLMDEGLSPRSAEYVRAILSGGKVLQAAVLSYLDGVDAARPHHDARWGCQS